MTECCASGRCEVCRPGFFGNDTPTRDPRGRIIDPFCMTCGKAITGKAYQRLPWGDYCSWECADND